MLTTCTLDYCNGTTVTDRQMERKSVCQTDEVYTMNCNKHTQLSNTHSSYTICESPQQNILDNICDEIITSFDVTLCGCVHQYNYQLLYKRPIFIVHTVTELKTQMASETKSHKIHGSRLGMWIQWITNFLIYVTINAKFTITCTVNIYISVWDTSVSR